MEGWDVDKQEGTRNLRRRLSLILLAAVAALIFIAAVLPVSAQVPTDPIPSLTPTPPIFPPSESPSPSPSEPPSSSTPPRETARPESGSQPPSSNQFQSPAPSAGPGGLPLLVVPDIRRTPSRSTARWLEIMAPLAARGFPLDTAMVLTSAPFPVAGFSTYSDDWMFPRYTPIPHFHEGTDIFADFGTPVVASGPGVVVAMTGTAIGGNAMWVAGDDHHGYYYAHLLSFAEGLQPGSRVSTGAVLGFVGNTGNAISTSPHLHFEIHPPITDRKGRVLVFGVGVTPTGIGQTKTPPVNPKPYLDQWLIQAEQHAQALVGNLVPRLNALSRQIHFSQRVADLFPAGSLSRPGDLMMFSPLDPVLAPLALAHQSTADRGLKTSGGGVAERVEAQQRAAAVRQAIESIDAKLAAFSGMVQFAR